MSTQLERDMKKAQRKGPNRLCLEVLRLRLDRDLRPIVRKVANG
jgi:hypothetical protein